MFFSRKWAILLVLAIATVVFSACVPQAPPGVEKEAPEAAEVEVAPEPAEEKVVVYAATESLETLDPHFVVWASTYGVSAAVYETLVRFDENMDIVPNLAESWDVSEDGRTWTFHLREGVMFHDGTHFNAEAVKYTWERFVDPDTGAKDTKRLTPYLDSMEVVDDHTFKITTKALFPEFLTNVATKALPIVSPTAAEKHAVADFGRKEPTGTGPFMFDKWVGPDRIELVRNPDYWGEKAKVDRVVFRTIPEESSIIAGLEAGEIDIASGISPDEVERLRENPKLKVSLHDAFRTFMINMLVTAEPFDDVRVRHAVNYAVDKEAITEHIFKGLAKPTETVLFPGLPYRVPQTPYEYNPEKAKELLAEAGYPDGFKTTIDYSSGYERGKEVIEAVAAYLEDVGIEAEIQVFEPAVYSKYFRDASPDAERRLFMVGKAAFGVDFNLTRLFTKASWDDDNRERYYNPRVEELLEEARFSFDEELRQRNYAEVQRIVWEEVPEIFMYTLKEALVTQANVGGVWIMPNGQVVLNGVTKD